MKIRFGTLRKLIREALFTENPGGPAIAADPTDVKGFYPYDVERGSDIHAFWYKSPGRTMGSDGDPGRPSNALEYIGMSPKSDGSEDVSGDSTETAAPEKSDAIDNSTEDIKS